MTVANTTSRNQYTATSGQTVFPYTFEIFDKGDVVVLKNGTALSEGTNYTVSGVGNDNGGNITLTVGATAGDILTIYRDMAYQRTTDYQTSGDFLAQEVNDDFDRLWLAVQQNEQANDRAIVKPITDAASIDMTLPSAADRANSYLTFDATGAPSVVAAGDPSAPDAITRQDFTGDGSTVVYTLASAPGAAGAGVMIFIDGIQQDKDSYTITGTTLTFSEAPPLNSNINLVQLKATDIGEADSASVTHIPAGTGAVQTSVQSKLRETVSVKDFGAVGDGVTDDTAAIQAAIDSGLSKSSCNIFFPSGTYLISQPLILDRGTTEQYMRVKIHGEGQATQILASTTTAAPASTRLQPARVSGAPGTDVDNYAISAIFIVKAPNSTNIRNVHFEGMRFGATGSAINKQVIGIFCPRIALSTFRDLWFSDLSEGIQARNIFVCDFQNIVFTECSYGFRHNRTASDYGGTSCSFDRVSNENCDHGWEFDNLVYSSMSACSAEGWASGNYGLKAINRSILTANLGLENGYGPGLYLDGEAATSYSNATIGGKTSITMNGCNLGLGDSSNTLITDFGISSAADFSVIKRDAALIFNGGLWNQVYNGSVKIQCSLEFDNAATTKVPTVIVNENIDYGLNASDFVSTGSGTKKGIASITVNGVTQYGTNSSLPAANKPFCQLRKTSNQTFSSGTPATLTFSAPASYFDPLGLVNGTNDGVTLDTAGMYRVKLRLQLGTVATTDSLQIYIRHGGSTWAAAEHYGTNTTKQMIELEALIPVFATGSDVTVTCARGASGTPVTVVGDGSFCQLTVEQL